jgi:hypothetical protein
LSVIDLLGTAEPLLKRVQLNTCLSESKSRVMLSRSVVL